MKKIKKIKCFDRCFRLRRKEILTKGLQNPRKSLNLLDFRRLLVRIFVRRDATAEGSDFIFFIFFIFLFLNVPEKFLADIWVRPPVRPSLQNFSGMFQISGNKNAKSRR